MTPASNLRRRMTVPSNRTFFGVMIMAAMSVFGAACNEKAHGATELPHPAIDAQSDKEAKPGETRTMIVAGGCFWCVEGVFEQLDAVKEAKSGYAGGTKETAKSKLVSNGDTGHAEAVQIVYDPTKITYG